MKTIAETKLTPKLLADAFWDLDSVEQAQFFAELYELVADKPYPAHSLGEMQWISMSYELEKNPKAKQMACALAANIYVRTTNWLSNSPH